MNPPNSKSKYVGLSIHRHPKHPEWTNPMQSPLLANERVSKIGNRVLEIHTTWGTGGKSSCILVGNQTFVT